MNDVTLKEYIEEQLQAFRREMAVQRESDQRALDLAHQGLQTRLNMMNEFRDQIRDERGQYVRVDTFRWTVGFLVGLLLLVVSVVALLRHGP